MSDALSEGAVATVASEPPSESPIAREALERATTALAALWKRIEKRAPPDVRARVEATLGEAASIAARDASVKDRVALAKTLEDLGAELRGRKPWEPTFYCDGRLAVVRAQDPITIRGAVDLARLEAFWERYVVRAERAMERLEYFLRRAGLMAPQEAAKRKPWDQPYIALDQYRELVWGKIAKGAPTKTRRE